MRHATAPRLFVVGECEMNWLPQVHRCKSWERGQCAGEKALHVGGAAAVKPAALAAQDERIGAPFRLAGRHDIHMSGDDVAPTLARADRDEEVGPVALGTGQNRHLGSRCLTVVADPIDDRAVWRAHNRGKCNQGRENFFHVHGGPLCLRNSPGATSLSAGSSVPCRIASCFGRRLRKSASNQRNLLAFPCKAAAKEASPNMAIGGGIKTACLRLGIRWKERID